MVTVVHESAHAISLIRFGCRFATIKIWQNDNGAVVGQVTKPSGTDDFTVCAIICLAGPTAQDVDPEEQTGSGDDLAMALDFLSRVESEPRPDLVSIRPFTELLIEHEQQ
jgi:hypothetical protein